MKFLEFYKEKASGDVEIRFFIKGRAVFLLLSYVDLLIVSVLPSLPKVWSSTLKLTAQEFLNVRNIG